MTSSPPSPHTAPQASRGRFRPRPLGPAATLFGLESRAAGAAAALPAGDGRTAYGAVECARPSRAGTARFSAGDLPALRAAAGGAAAGTSVPPSLAAQAELREVAVLTLYGGRGTSREAAGELS